ncbi:hypothetical protein [Ensifer sp. SSB1]|jgi:hypothetical protein|uniref:hypothetical protein n=1 Tax=Ensifer sp. SSB1 TaxID=2795385 RepID=UPI001A598DCB|nr:hypothetical protein [Ensifer sp. SSB1]MBK5569353.1 hypothetical protein [Ensifer sp. SSB1]
MVKHGYGGRTFGCREVRPSLKAFSDTGDFSPEFLELLGIVPAGIIHSQVFLPAKGTGVRLAMTVAELAFLAA